ncbi:hypothetical protein N7495_009665 [Penicillium taxi]|uniref:uncharacterized protein n=1 Tax=Penicillium taxi TaxID=168475 RepID=UPI00254598D8|nr:uncharacterized protein N7495_009665 [Penicillium taxi]KAJ5885155.1 hypothetical protein N7495_009665 [Penicillium taxi]
MATSHLPLFGGSRAWSKKEWTSSDDRVRGGSSHSTLTCSPTSLTAKFHGNLDIKTLGGAGFASQRTATTEQTWDISAYDGIEVVLERADTRKYTLTLKDEILPKRPDGREASSVSWEVDFQVNAEDGKNGTVLFFKWSDFRATYRGRDLEGDDVKPLDLKRVKRFAIMVRSFFGGQEGDFELNVVSISALRTERYRDEPWVEVDEKAAFEQEEALALVQRPSGWFGWLSSCLGA